MKLKTPSRVVEIEYSVAPWHLRLRWWLEERLWLCCRGFEQPGAASPEQVNPLWWRR